jgi:acyl-CoA synthetase (AMP-forming)/AMP-acid ligase II
VDPERPTLPALLDRNRARHGGEPAIVTADRSITHAELDDAGRALAARLVGAGVSGSARVGLLAPNGIDWAVVAAAVMRVGATLVPLSTIQRPPELADQLRAADVTHLVAARSFRGRSYLEEVAGIAGDVPSLRAVWPIDELPETAADEGRALALEAAVRPADDLVVLFTSGSTGAPKAAVHTHGGAIRATAAGLAARCVRPGERLYIPMPFFWTGGFSSGLLTALVAGATLLTEAEPEPSRTLAFLARERVTLFRGWPDQAAALAAHPDFAATDLSSLTDGSLSAVLPPDRRPAPGARANVFGMTETFGPWCGDRLDTDLPPGKGGSCGRPFPGIEVRVVDGELHLRGPNLLRTLVGREREEVFTADGWFPTGDRGRVDDDGYVWFEGRLDDMFKVKGATVYPWEVEAALRSVDLVRQAHVTDVEGEVGAAVVTDAALDDVRAALGERLSAFKVPTRWLATSDADAIPMTATGKVDKRALRALLEEQA